FIDTSVLLEFLDVPGHNGQHAEITAEMERRIAHNVTFVLPVTTIIETGNHIAQCSGDRRGAAKRFVRALELARTAEPPWIVRDVAWNGEFLERFVEGASTGSDLLTHLSNKTLGSGDVAILVEREQFKKGIAATVEIWTLDQKLRSFS
ncbi:hypothetical protein SAMN02745244_03526, partial [Tessaracoccus bendigoensis DSM 12906]